VNHRLLHAGAWRRVLAAAVLLLVLPRPAAAQQTATDVLSFLLINKSVATGDFTRDEQAAAATRDAIALFLRSELGTVPINSPDSGFTYRWDPALGASVRSSDSFGPFFTARSLTGGRQRLSLSVSYSQATYDNIGGRKLRDGSLVSIASVLQGDTQPFDAETLTLRIQTRTTTVAGHWGVTDRMDVAVAVPFVSLTLSGERIDTYRGTSYPQATGFASASGPGDAIVRVKYNAIRRGGSGLSLGAESRLPTGDADNFLGSGHASIAPWVIGSVERGRVGVHADGSYAYGGVSREFDYGGALTIAAASRLTIVGEVMGRRLSSGGQLIDTTEPRPGLVGVDTIRLTGTTQGASRVLAVFGVRWNVVSQFLVSVSVLRPLTSAGLNALWVPTVTFDYSLGR
jgi:hypothetical protein